MLLDTPLWRQTPPAVFPVCLGFMSLALGWRNAADVLPWISEDIGNLMLAASTGYFLWFVAFYLSKLIARPMVLFEDMHTSPARAGIAAMAMAMMLLAAALLPFGVSVPQVWWTGVVMQIIASAIVLQAMWREPAEKRHFSTFQYLTFVGPVVGPIAGVPLGYVWQSTLLVLAALLAYVIVTTGILLTIRRNPVLTPLRPSMMIFLAPLCMFALGFGMLGYEVAFTVFYWAGSVMALGLLMLVPWMIKGGYTPIWGAFTFPIGAFLNVQVMAVAKGHGILAVTGVYAAMAIGTPVVLYLVYRTVMEWVTGDLAKKSAAATA
ncbi:SLAC1 family transporter [Profundibacter sp.]